MNRRKFLFYNSIFFTPIPYYFKQLLYISDIEKYDYAWDNNLRYIPQKFNTIKSLRDNKLHIHTINVAQGDSTLIVTPRNKIILIDTGHAVHDGRHVINYLNEQDIDRIDYLILTHPHWDHIGGFKQIINMYENNLNGIKNIYHSGMTHNTNTYETYNNTLQNFTGNKKIVSEGDNLNIDNISFNILNPIQGLNEDESINDNSIVIHIKYENTNIILPSDAEKYTENRLSKKYTQNLNSDIYKVGHHGENTSTHTKFISKIDPDYAIISSAYNSRFNHPDTPVLERLSNKNIKTYWTGIHGSIVKISDGQNWDIVPQVNKTIKPLSVKNHSQIKYPPHIGVKQY